MLIRKTREEGVEVWKFTCDYDGCTRRAFAVMNKENMPKDYDQTPGWEGFGYDNAEDISKIQHYCRRHSQIIQWFPLSNQ